MAQRILTCPNCNQQVHVPDNYFRAAIQCMRCGAQLDRFTGQVAGAAPGRQAAGPRPAAYPPSAPPVAYPQAAQPVAYPFQGQTPQHPVYSRPAKAKRWWLIPLVVIGSLVGVLVIVAVVAGPMLLRGNISAEGDWHLYKSEEGNFSIEFPSEPKNRVQKLPTDLGTRKMYSAYLQPGVMFFEAGYFDLGDGPEGYYEFDYNAAAASMKQDGGRVTSQKQYMVGRYRGSLAVIEDSGRYSTAMMVRVHNRVFIAVVENHSSGDQDIVDRFVKSFKLTANDGDLGIDYWYAYRTKGNSWTHRHTTDGQGSEYINEMTYEVLQVQPDRALVRTTMSQLPNAPTETWIEFREGSEPPMGNVSHSRETISVEAGEFDCTKTVFDDGNIHSTTWTSRKTGLLVRVESKHAGMPKSITELIRTNVK
ncbi:MAG: hypothetical protein H6841_03825 [Planctomycetes bacterium]|nr:hypothetical protein [Planctomycetota bacterium]MCB9934504.1 hypothetical protein [Planctomycetota bacterium]